MKQYYLLSSMNGRSICVIRYIRGKVVLMVKERHEGLKYCNSNYTSYPKILFPIAIRYGWFCEGLFSPRGTVTEISHVQSICG